MALNLARKIYEELIVEAYEHTSALSNSIFSNNLRLVPTNACGFLFCIPRNQEKNIVLNNDLINVKYQRDKILFSTLDLVRLIGARTCPHSVDEIKCSD